MKGNVIVGQSGGPTCVINNISFHINLANAILS